MNVTPELVLAQWAVGMSGVLFVVTRWRVTSPGFPWLVSGVSAALALFAWAAGGQGEPLLLVAALCSLLSIGASAAKWTIGQDVLEAGAAAVGLLVLGSIAAGEAGDVTPAMTVLRAIGGAAFLGAVSDEMSLGHWYLIDPKLPKTAIRRLNLISLGTLGGLAALVLVPPASILSAVSDSALLVVAWFGLAAFSAVLLHLVGRALREPGYASVMSATGLSYVATMVAFGAVVVGWMAIQ